MTKAQKTGLVLLFAVVANGAASVIHAALGEWSAAAGFLSATIAFATLRVEWDERGNS